MGLLDTFSRWAHPRSEEAPPLWSELSFGKRLYIAFEVVLALTTVFGIVILILEVSGL
ncbi:MAG TPA: hypothetical protein HA286_00985 [Candidatus Poseidoniaceae archaeon]|nr:hypothetical protein [Candidatus Poseidoniaceae archaeon]